jgi:hypothetical protein
MNIRVVRSVMLFEATLRHFSRISLYNGVTAFGGLFPRLDHIFGVAR